MNLKDKKMWGLGAIILIALVGGTVFLNALRPLPGSRLEPAIVPVVPIAASGSRLLSIAEDGNLWSLGCTIRLEDGTLVPQDEPQKVMEDVVAVFADGGTTMMIASDGTLWTQGSEIRGLRHWFVRFIWMITPLSAPHNHEPVAIMNNTRYVTMVVFADYSHAMAITSDGGLWGWGCNRFGQLGIGTTRDSHRRPTRVMDNVVAVSTGREHTMAITADSTLWGWGSNRSGQIGDGTTENRHSPVRIMDNVIYVSASGSRTVAITSYGELWAWGNFFAGRSPWGDDGITVEAHLDPVKMMDDVISVAAGHGHTMAITSDATLWGWGHNMRGQLGDGTTEDRENPVRIMDDVTSVFAVGSLTMAITSDGGLWAWGSNRSGQLGDGTTEDRKSPVRIMDDVVAVSIDFNHTLALTSDGTLWAWGNNNWGQLGDGTTENRHSPTRIMDGIKIP